MSQRQDIESIQALRGLAALLVVLVHLAVMERKYGDAGALLIGSFSAGNAGVDLFFVISGFVMVLVSARRGGSRGGGAGTFLFRRATRIYPVYWFYCVGVLAVSLVRPSWVNASSEGEPDLLASFLLLPTGEVPLLLVAWTLEYEVFFYLLFAGAMALGGRWRLPLLLAVLGGLAALGAVWAPGPGPARVLTSPLLLEFGAGCVLGVLHLRGRWYGGLPLFLAGAALLGLQAAGVDWPAAVGLAGTPFERPLTYGLAGVLMVYGLVGWEMKGTARLPRALLRLGDASYTLYLSHVLVLSAVGRLWQGLGLTVLPNALLLAVLLAAALGWALLGYAWIEKPLIGLTRHLDRAPARRATA